jgi:hypothetical protein
MLRATALRVALTVPEKVATLTRVFAAYNVLTESPYDESTPERVVVMDGIVRSLMLTVAGADERNPRATCCIFDTRSTLEVDEAACRWVAAAFYLHGFRTDVKFDTSTAGGAWHGPSKQTSWQLIVGDPVAALLREPMPHPQG